ncbi:MAG TPA: MBL fold metallo-hydrolase [Solirubrobacterales bacterium]|nr:MBL fold metallo-hydrolase [Solirubrobacterales bacterium]
MKQVADGVWQLPSFPPDSVNTFLLEDVLVDAATRYDGRRLLKALRGHTVSAHALTHAHSDHQGASHRICTELSIPFWVGDADADAAENPKLIGQRQPNTVPAQFFFRTCTGPGHPVDRRLHEGDEVAGFQVLHVPGHSAGHVAFWRESDGVLVAGDVFNTMHPILQFPRGLRLPPDYFTPDPARNREQAKRLGALEPKLLLVGHGPPMRDTKRIVEFCAAL